MSKKLFDEYYVGRRGLYHNKNVVILSTNYDVLTYQDFGFKFEEFEIKSILFGGSRIYISLYNIRTQVLYKSYTDLNFDIKKYNKTFFTKKELRVEKLKKLIEK